MAVTTRESKVEYKVEGKTVASQDVTLVAEVSSVADALEYVKATFRPENAAEHFLADWIRGVNLRVQNTTRGALVAANEGPEKAQNKAIADLVKARAAMGRPISEERARAIVLGD